MPAQQSHGRAPGFARGQPRSPRARASGSARSCPPSAGRAIMDRRARGCRPCTTLGAFMSLVQLSAEPLPEAPEGDLGPGPTSLIGFLRVRSPLPRCR